MYYSILCTAMLHTCLLQGVCFLPTHTHVPRRPPASTSRLTPCCHLGPPPPRTPPDASLRSSGLERGQVLVKDIAWFKTKYGLQVRPTSLMSSCGFRVVREADQHDEQLRV